MDERIAHLDGIDLCFESFGDPGDPLDGAELLMVEGMAHDLPRYLWPVVLDAIADLASR